MLKIKPFILIACFGIYFLLWAQNVMAYFESTGAGVRPAGMGEAFVSIADDSNAVLFNPAGLARIRGIELNGMYADLYSNLNTKVFTGEDTYYGYHFLSFVIPVSRDTGSLGLSWTGFHTLFYKENCLTMSYGRRIFKKYNVDLGINIKAMQWRVEPNRYSTDPDYFPYSERGKTGLTTDLGGMATFIDHLHIGLSLENIIPCDLGLTTKEILPFQARAGVSYTFRVPTLSYLDSVQPAIELNWQKDFYNIKVGVEALLLKKMIALRIGLNMDSFTAGAGFWYRNETLPIYFKMDYAFTLPFEIKDSLGSHRIGMIVQWNPLYKKKQKKVVKAMVTPIVSPSPSPTPDINNLINTAVEVATTELRENIEAQIRAEAALRARAVDSNRTVKVRMFEASSNTDIVVGFERKNLSDYGDLQEVLMVLDKLEDYLEHAAKVSIIRHEFSTREEMINAFKRGELDFGIAPADVFRVLQKSKDAVPCFRIQINGSVFQKLCLWGLENDAIQTVSALKGKRLGYINGDHLKDLKNIFFKDINDYQENNYFSKQEHFDSPISALVALQIGEIDVLLGLEYLGFIAKRLEHRFHNTISVLAVGSESEWLNTSVFSRTYLPEVKQEKHRALIKVLFEAHKEKVAREFLDYFYIEKFIPAY